MVDNFKLSHHRAISNWQEQQNGDPAKNHRTGSRQNESFGYFLLTEFL